MAIVTSAFSRENDWVHNVEGRAMAIERKCTRAAAFDATRHTAF
jgi:hypothetical protein